MQRNKSILTLHKGISIAFIVLLFVSLAFGLIINLTNNTILDEKIVRAKEEARPADIEIVTLKDSECQECFDVKQMIDIIKKENVAVKTEKIIEYKSPQGQELIKKYNITKIPIFIISGEIDKNDGLKNIWPEIGKVEDNTFVLTQVRPPYVFAQTGEIKGRITLTMLLDTACQDCYDVTQHEIILSQFGMPLDNKKFIEINSKEGQDLKRKYNIKFIPTVILAGDLKEYPYLMQVWNQVGTIEKDGTYIFREGVTQMGVYKNLTTNKVVKPPASNKK